METIVIICIAAIVVMTIAGFVAGKRSAAESLNRQTGHLQDTVASLETSLKEKEAAIARLTEDIRTITADGEVQRNNALHYADMVEEMKRDHATRLQDMQEQHDKKVLELKATHHNETEQLKKTYAQQLRQMEEHARQQTEMLRQISEKQLHDQMNLIKEQMKATSEEVLKARQEELGARNREQVSRIIDPLQKSLKDMETALNMSKEQQKDAITRLDESIKLNMERAATLGETADRLTRALTGQVKVQGNFGELKLKQLLEDMELKEGEQFDTQATLRDRAGKALKGDDGKGLVPDFILHFPNDRHVVVDAKMSLTDYERYMNAEDGSDEKSACLKAHIDSVRAQVRRLAKKEYTRFLPEGCNKLNFVIMYIPIEGALNLAILNDTTLWKEAYDEGVMILGPQTMYMNIRVLEMMWTQVRQLKSQQVMMDAANMVVERVQDFSARFMDVENAMNDTLSKMNKLKITTAVSGPSIITAARKLIKAGAMENKKKKTIAAAEETFFVEDHGETDTRQQPVPTQGTSIA